MPKYRYIDYVDLLNPGDCMTRQWFADVFGVGCSTARYHLERAVVAGELHKFYGWTGKQSAWLYGLPETLPKLVEGTQ